MGERKEMVTKSKPDFNNIQKATKIKMGIITNLILTGDVKESLFLTGFVRQVSLLSVSLTNRDPCGITMRKSQRD